MRILWLIFTLMPAPFLFHFYEYGRHIKQEKAPFLLLGSVTFVIIVGYLSSRIKIRYIILANVITGFLSVLLAMHFIPEDGSWFKPVGRDWAIIFAAIIFFAGQLIVRHISRRFFVKQKNNG